MPNIIDKIQRSLNSINNYQSKKFLLTISGGIDSIALFHLFKKLNLAIGVAHCNFQLRGKDSDLDEQLVKETCGNSILFHTKKINLERYQKEKGVSIQMAARETRYQWFNDLASEHQYDYIITAHHLNDQIETFFLNLARGTGIEGLTGIKQFNGRIFRPLLSVSRKEIKNYVNKHNIPYREDTSNASLKYKRNKIRHELIPILKEINPSFEDTMANNLKIIEATNNIYINTINSGLNNDVIKTKDTSFFIEIEKLLSLKQPQHYLFEYIRRFNFNSSQSNTIHNIISSEFISGKVFLTKTHKLVIDRLHIIIFPIEIVNNDIIEIKKDTKSVTNPISLSFDVVPNIKTEIIPKPIFAFLDYDKVEYPITLRKWQKGDSFIPLGMSRKKKLSDFFIDKKLSLMEKEATYVLVSNDKIIWVIGHRISDLHKVTSSTKTTLVVTLKE